MSFEFSTPEGAIVKCETLEDMITAYNELWREHKEALSMPISTSLLTMQSVAAQSFPDPSESCGQVGHPNAPHIHGGDFEFETPKDVVPVPDPEIERPTIVTTRQRAEIFEMLLTYGDEGTTFADLCVQMDQADSTLRSKFRFLVHDGYVEPASKKHHWHVTPVWREAKIIITHGPNQHGSSGSARG